MDKRYFSEKIVKWYQENKRSLPWRQTKDPYRIWLSEVILQQTRVSQGLPYYNSFIEKFPTVTALAKAPEQEVLRLWQGLGYYSRARNLHKCAKVVQSDYAGKFPTEYEDLKKLPGIGDYTAAAIASIAFKQPVAVVDGNVFRVLSRHFGIDAVINSPDGKKIFTRLANELISSLNPDMHNQAVMEFGALFCTPKNPGCEQCVFQTTCFAFKNKLQHALPVKGKLKKAKKRYFYYIVIEQNKSLLMKKRADKDIWLGLYDFPVLESPRPIKTEKLLATSEIFKKLSGHLDSIVISKPYKHQLTHQTIYSRFVVVNSSNKVVWDEKTTKFYSFTRILKLPKPVLISRFLTDQYFL